jgi:hypothetical protein
MKEAGKNNCRRGKEVRGIEKRVKSSQVRIQYVFTTALVRIQYVFSTYSYRRERGKEGI